MEFDEVRTRFGRALMAFARSDRYLLVNNLSERCIASRIAYHLQPAFPEYKVDVEYNRAGELAKRLALPDECAKHVDDHGRALVIPDVIIHRRGSKGPNLLVVEIKKANNPMGFDCDRRRVHAFREQLGYKYGVLLECRTGPSVGLRVLEWLPSQATAKREPVAR